MPGTPALGTLAEEICFDLQAFIRLWKKLGWSISDVHAIISSLQCRSEGDSGLAPYVSSGITADMLENLAAVKEIEETYNLQPSEMQPLWGNINSNGNNSLYSRLFLQPRITQLGDVFKISTSGKYFASEDKSYMIKAHKSVLLVTIGVPEKEFPAC